MKSANLWLCVLSILVRRASLIAAALGRKSRSWVGLVIVSESLEHKPKAQVRIPFHLSLGMAGTIRDDSSQAVVKVREWESILGSKHIAAQSSIPGSR